MIKNLLERIEECRETVQIGDKVRVLMDGKEIKKGFVVGITSAGCRIFDIDEEYDITPSSTESEWFAFQNGNNGTTGGIVLTNRKTKKN